MREERWFHHQQIVQLVCSSHLSAKTFGLVIFCDSERFSFRVAYISAIDAAAIYINFTTIIILRKGRIE